MSVRLACYFLMLVWAPALALGQESAPAQETYDQRPSSLGRSTAVGASTATPPMIVSYHRSGANDTQNHYQFELIEQALEITRAEFGDYLLRPYGGAPTAKRQSILISEGKLMNIQWASPGTPIAQAEVIAIPINILRGLLGIRLCLVNREQLPKFAEIRSLEDLRKIKIGQGQDWTDTLIYELNDIPLLESSGLQQLFPILASHRFDCLALGANEIQVKYAEQQAQYPNMVIEPELLLYYHFPTYLYVSERHPLLAERILKGLQQLQESGAFDQLFRRYFADNLAPLNLSGRRIICLKSPYQPELNPCDSPIILPDLAPPASAPEQHH